MKTAITGSSGLIGGALAERLAAGGHEVSRLVRRGADAAQREIAWNPEYGEIDPAPLEGLDAVVHLAGQNIASGRWDTAMKGSIGRSREAGTRLLCEALAQRKARPKVLVSASAVGFYGNRDDEELNEESETGQGFLAGVCQEWEKATEAAEKAGIRVVRLRIGVVLSASGGALARMLRPFRLGLGGPLGGGRQWMSWIALDDLLAAVEHALATESLRGAVNATAPEPVRNREFARTLGRVLKRPALFPAPAWAIRRAFGEMGQALLLDGQRVLPKKLLANGFQFEYGELEPALRHLLRKP